MRAAILTLAALGTLALLVLWGADGLNGVSDWAQAAQHRFQSQLADGLRALHAGQPGALVALWAMCFAYGVAHAAGPGHGKFLLGAYGAGTRAPMGRLMGVGLAASVAQGISAVVLVYGGVLVFNATRASVQHMGEVWLDRASLVAIAMVGLWLVWRGARRCLRAQGRAGPVSTHGPDAGICDTCGHRHGPSVEDVAQLQGWRDAAALIGAIALRPCTGALFLLILTWRMGLVWQGIAGALVMALGTASVTMGVAALAVLARDGALGAARRLGRVSGLVPVLELGAGLIIVILALNMLKNL
ncbi:nickel/cobalt transporter [Roseinatronobacter sp. NSM]|uniref:nickel/cobalt transporter n=1 Tax=Roseinatronobacter sp. NSM TaxID=3457785 RepID=UPI0040353F9F